MKKIEKNPDLMIPISKDNRLKELILEYMSEKLSAENGEVAVENMLETVFMAHFADARQLIFNLYTKKYAHPTGAQGEQDIKMLKYLETIENGFFIEAGANNGLWQSNTLLYETDYNWSGILVEPNPARYEECVLNRPNSIVENYALVPPDHKKNTISGFFQFSGSAPDAYENSLCAQVYDWNRYLDDKRWADKKPIDVPAITLQALLEKHSIKGSTVDFFSLDVEGYEIEVLNGLNLNVNRPTYILIETANNLIRAQETLGYMKFYNYEHIERISVNDDLYKVK